jgi:cytochrome c5
MMSILESRAAASTARTKSGTRGSVARCWALGKQLPFRSLWSFTAGAAACALALACGASTPPGASDANFAQAKSRASEGAALYDRVCAKCHGPRGEGLAGAPPIVGATALPRYPRDQSGVQLYQDPQQIQRQAQLRVPGAASRPEFVNANDVFQYLQRHRSEVIKPDTGLDVSDSELWAILSFVLVANGSQVPDTGISPANAGSVLIRQE